MTSETAPGTGGEGRPDRADPARPSAVSGDPTPSAEPDPVAARADSAPVSDSPDDTPPATTDTDSVPAAPADAAMPAMTPADSDTAAGTVEDSVPHAEEPVSDDTTQVRAADGDVPAGAAGDADRTVEVDPVPPADESPTQHVDPASHGAAGPFPPPGGTTPTDSVPPGSVPPGSVPPGAGSVPPGDDGTAGGYGAPPPPPPGFGAPPNEGELPPIAAFAFRHGLVRPVQGKKIVGVCAALGRATNTDPVLWRVVLTVTAFFGGVGLLAYVLGWLLTPREDDRATPLESVLGRGRSSTSPAVAVLLGVAGIGLVFFILNDSFRFTVLAAALAATVAVVLTRRSQARSAAPASAGGAPVPPPGPPPASTTPTATAQPTAASYTVPPTGVQQPAYRAPFAPHGPYGPGVPPPPPPPQFGGRPPRPPKRPKEKSALGRITFFALCLALGGAAVLAVLGLHVPPSGFFALGLAVIGTGLVVGAWRGRARWLIAIGCVFALALPISWVSERADFGSVDRPDRMAVRDMTWAPGTAEEILPEYRTTVGDATLDLSHVDFTGAGTPPPPPIRVDAEVGDVKVILPKDLDVTVELGSGAGDAMIFGREMEGPQRDHASISDNGDDGPGGPRLTLDVQSGVGNVEVTR